MDRLWLNKISRERPIDPAEALKSLRAIEPVVAASDLSDSIKQLRTHNLKRDREIREACLFCYGMSQRLERPVWVYPIEDSDYDFVAACEDECCRYFVPVQLKEVVPDELNSSSSLQFVINGLVKYPTSAGLVVAIHLNKVCRFDPREIVLPDLKIAELWIFGSTTEDQSRWFLFGNMLGQPFCSEFDYPV